METESPVSKVGRVKFGWRLGTEPETEVVVAVGATTVAESTVEATEVDRVAEAKG